MVVIRPFKAIRPHQKYAEKIATLPYDVLNSEEAYELAKDNPYSYLHIDKAEIDLPKSISPYDDKVYETAKKNLTAFRKKEWLIKDEVPSLYLYELTMNGKSQTGLVTCTSIDDYLNQKIKKHEFTRVEKEQDRIRHVDSCDANTSPIFLAYRDNTDVTKLIHDWKENHPPIYDYLSFHEVTHRVWIIQNPGVIEQLVAHFKDFVPSLYIADGHHRTESAVKVGQLRRQQFPNYNKNDEFNYFLSALFPESELSIWEYNRVIKGEIPSNFFQQLEKIFEVSSVDASEYKPNKKGNFGMYLQHKWYNLKIKAEAAPSGIVDSLDAAFLQNQVLEKIFHIQDIRTDQRIDFIGGIRGAKELVQLVDSEAFTVAFSLYPTSMTELLTVADANGIMPPKSTWFEPKLQSGLFLHDLETKQ